MYEKRLTMKLYRPKISVGIKTFLALSVVFWVPVTIIVLLLFNLYRDFIFNEAADSIHTHLKSAKIIYGERVKELENVLDTFATSPEVQEAFSKKDVQTLHNHLIDINQKYSHVKLLIAIDDKQNVIVRRSGKSGDVLTLGDFISKAILSGKSINTTELVSKAALINEDPSLTNLLKDIGLVQFVISPVLSGGSVKGAIVAGILITADPWIGNEVYYRFGVETAIFAGKPPETSFLHSAPSIPRKAWLLGQKFPEGLNDISMGKPYYGIIDLSGVDTIVAFEPIQDSTNRIIGAIGVSKPSHYEAAVIKILQKGVVVGAIVGLLIALIVTIFVRRDIIHPLRFLVKAMNDFGKGDLGITVDLTTGDEFEKLGDGFNTMAVGIRQRDERLKKHNEVAKLLMSTLDLKELIENVLRIAVQVTGSQIGIVYLSEEKGESLIPTVQFGTTTDLKTLKRGEGFPGRAAKDQTTLILAPEEGSEHEKIEKGYTESAPKEVAYIPLVYNEKVLGVLLLGTINRYSMDERELFDYLASQISIALDNAVMHNRIQELSITDGLTGIYNRRYLNERLEVEWARFQRHQSPMSVILCDIDDFKSVNDNYGHDKGDDVIVDMAAIFKEATRTEDVAGRYGGEEFVAILPETGIEDALALAERIAEKARKNHYTWMGRAATLSVGVACSTTIKVDSGEALVQAADHAMYDAKTSGKDKVVAATDKK